MSKELKTNAMRMLDKLNIPYDFRTYECDSFVDGVQVAKLLGYSPDVTFKTLVTVGKSAKYYVFVLPADCEMDLKKCAKAVGEKSVEPIHVKDIQSVTGYIRGGCSPIGMKKPFRTVIHESARSLETVIVSGGRLGLQLILTPNGLVRESMRISLSKLTIYNQKSAPRRKVAVLYRYSHDIGSYGPH